MRLRWARGEHPNPGLVVRLEKGARQGVCLLSERCGRVLTLDVADLSNVLVDPTLTPHPRDLPILPDEQGRAAEGPANRLAPAGVASRSPPMMLKVDARQVTHVNTQEVVLTSDKWPYKSEI